MKSVLRNQFNFAASVLSALALGAISAIASVDSKSPSVSILSPKSNAQFDAPDLPLMGRATDNVGVDHVSLLLNGDTTDVTLDTPPSWSADLQMLPGTNTVLAWAVDVNGNKSSAVQRSFFYAVPSTVTLATDGEGTARGSASSVTPFIGRGYTFGASPARGQVFDYWSDANGKILGSNTVLQFVIRTSDETLTAHFVTNSFAHLKGIYRGLCHGTPSGYIRVTTTTRGAYSGLLLLGVNSYTFSGKFVDAGAGIASSDSNPVSINADTTLVVHLDLDTQPKHGAMGGSISINGEQVADVTARFFKRLAKTTIGRYNIAVGPAIDINGAPAPSGYGYGTALVDQFGNVSLMLHLADSVGPVSFSSTMYQDGSFPFYSSLYTSKSLYPTGPGWMMGWINTRNPKGVISGQVEWVKPASNSKFYPDGFNASVTYNVAHYTAPGRGQNIFHWTSGVFKSQGGNFSDYKIQLMYQPKGNQFSFLDDNPFNITLSLSTSGGILTGTFISDDQKLRVFHGAVLGKSDLSPVPAVFGFVLGDDQSSFIYLGQ